MSEHKDGDRLSWSEICSRGEFRGRWVALDSVRYDEVTSRPTEGTVVDADDDPAELCTRIQKSQRRCCAIFYCEDQPQAPMPRSSRSASRGARMH